MASRSSNGTGGGNASAGASWSGGVAPVFGDKVTIVSGDTITLDFSPFVITGGSGYTSKPTVTLGGAFGSGATAVAIMSNVNGTGSVVGIKVTQPGSGYITPTVGFSGGSPTVAATATATVYNGRFAYSLGDDTTTAININSGGTLKWSRTVSTSIAFYGSLVLSNGGTFDMGTSASPIAYGVVHSIFLNDSAALAALKYGIDCNGAGANNFFIFGASKTINTYLTATANSAQANIVVNDATGWEKGDRIWLAPTTNVPTQREELTISSISGSTVTFTSNLANQHLSGGRIGNADNNLLIAPVTIGAATVYPGYISIYNGSATTADTREVQYCTFEQGGDGSTTNKIAAFLIQSTGLTSTSVSPFKKIANCSFRVGGTTTTTSVGLCPRANFATFPVEDCAFYTLGSSATSIAFRNGGVIDGVRCFFYGSTANHITSSYEQGSVGSTFTDSYFLGSTSSPISVGTGTLLLDACYIDCSVRAISSGNLSSLVFRNSCQIGTTFGGFSSTAHILGSVGLLPTWDLTDAYFGSTPAILIGTADETSWNNDSKISVINRGTDVTAQEVYLKNGRFFRDNSVFKRSTSSIRAETSVSSRAFSKTVSFTAESGVAYAIVGYLRKNSTYGSSTRPTVTLSGAGITPSTFTMTDSTDTWEEFTLTGTQSTGAPASLTFTFTAQSATSTGKAYCDGVLDAPFVIATRHYGYQFDSNVFRTVDSVITETDEATVAAYTGIGISGSTITLSSDHSIQEVYDYCQYYLCENLSTPVFFTSSDGVNFSSAYNITINTGVSLTGTGAITITGGNILTMTGTASSTLDITHTSGTKVWTRISLSGLTTNSRVRLYDSTSTTELYNAVVAATSLSYQTDWTADHTITYRVSYVNGATAKEFIEASGTFTSSGLSVSISQSDDAVYIANGISGSTVTGITITPSPARVKISLAGGTVSWPSIYAYQCDWLYGATGIADEAAFITASDTANYTLTGFDIRNDSAVPLTITGGWGKDSVTGTIAGCIDVAGSTGNIYPEPDHVVAYESSQSALTTLASKIIVSSSRL